MVLAGSHASLPEQTNHGETFPDTQFWKQAVDPILAYDPFASLMMVLFSLPLPCLSSTEFFMALVHLFYVVSVIQVLSNIILYMECDILIEPEPLFVYQSSVF